MTHKDATQDGLSQALGAVTVARKHATAAQRVADANDQDDLADRWAVIQDGVRALEAQVGVLQALVSLTSDPGV